MKVSILFKDGDLKTFDGIWKIANASTNIVNDWIYLYRIGDPHGDPSLRWPMAKVTCIEVLADGFVDNRFNK